MSIFNTFVVHPFIQFDNSTQKFRKLNKQIRNLTFVLRIYGTILYLKWLKNMDAINIINFITLLTI